MMAGSGGAALAGATTLVAPTTPSASAATTKAPKLPPKPRASKSPAKSKRGAAGGKKVADGKQFSCHYCRQKRADIVDCPQHVEGHRWCGSCIRNHLGHDIEDIRANPTKFWPDGCPRCTKSCTCSHCRVGVGGKRKGECSEDDALEAEYEQLLAKQREANGGAANSRGSSCHYCRQKKSLYVECNKSRFHRWCASCVKNGFGVDFGELLRDKDKAWPHGCPICQATCTCSLCKRRAVAKLTKGGDTALAGMLVDFSTEDKNETNASKKKKQKKQQQQRSPASRPKKKAAKAKAKANVQSASYLSPKAATRAAAMAPVHCLPSSVPASPPQHPLPPSARGDIGECAAMDVDLDDNSKLPHLVSVASFNSIMSSQTKSQQPLLGVGSDDSANDASLLLDMLASACQPDVTETQSSSPAKDVQIAPTAFFAAAAAQASAKSAFRDLAHSPKRTTSSVESVPDSPTEPPPTMAAVSATATSSSAASSANVGATRNNSSDGSGPPPVSIAQSSLTSTVDHVPQPQPVPEAVSPSKAVPAATTTEPEGSPCSSIGSDSPPFSPSLAPDGKADNGSHATSETLLPMDKLQLPGSPRSLHGSAKYHRSGSAFGDSTSNSLTTGRDLRDDLKLTDGAGVAMTMLARTATMPSVTQNTILSRASPRAASVAMGFLTMNMGVMAKTAPEKEETKCSEGRCSPRAATGGGGLLQELNGVTQISPSGRTAHLEDHKAQAHCKKNTAKVDNIQRGLGVTVRLTALSAKMRLTVVETKKLHKLIQ